ncbi:MAG TPA: hypothetical protein VKT71_07720 [Candidatus Acidoferrales bacterium]|nr:hypothetical protein [Candidatus Acidoferrales bacterium]
MVRSRRGFIIAAAVATAAVATSLLVYGGIRRTSNEHASFAPELLSALPSGAPTIIYLDLAAIRASSFYQHRPDKGPIAIPNRDYAEFMRTTGFDFEKDLDRVVVASWPTASTAAQQKNVVIAEGRFDRAKIRSYAEEKGKIEQQQGREVLLFPSTPAGNWGSITFLDPHRIAIVAGPSIAPLYAGNPDRSAADPARERAARLDGAAAFMITQVPPIPDKPGAASQNPASAQLLSLARSVHWVTLAARPEGDNLRVSLEGECDTASSAVQLKSTLDVLRMFGRAGLESPKASQSMNAASVAQLENLLSGIEITQSAERVRILLELTPDVFKLSEKNKPQ